MAYSAAAFSNLSVVPKRTALDRKRDAVNARDAEATLKRKVDQANRVLDGLIACEGMLAAQILRLQRRKAALAARAARIEDAILAYMDDQRIDVLTGTRCTMRRQPAAAALEVFDPSLLPRQYLRTPKTPAAAPDKVAIKRALDAHDDLDPAAWGCRLTTKISLIRK